MNEIQTMKRAMLVLAYPDKFTDADKNWLAGKPRTIVVGRGDHETVEAIDALLASEKAKKIAAEAARVAAVEAELEAARAAEAAKHEAELEAAKTAEAAKHEVELEAAKREPDPEIDVTEGPAVEPGAVKGAVPVPASGPGPAAEHGPIPEPHDGI